jgi:transposase
MGTRRNHTKEFKEEAVRLSESSHNKSQVARDLGIHVSLLGRWKRELQQGGKVAFPGNGKPRDEEVVQLKKENRRLQEEVEILKKAMGIFSRRPI